MNENVLFCISNASTETYDNTLTNFTNKFPKDFVLSENFEWEIAVESIGLEYRKVNFDLPSNIFAPHIFFLTKENSFNSLSDFSSPLPTQYFKFPSLTYTFSKFEEVISQYNTSFWNFLEIKILQTSTYLEGKKYISFAGGYKVNELKKVYIHEKILQNFGFNVHYASAKLKKHVEKEIVSISGLFENEPYFIINVDLCSDTSLEEEKKKVDLCTSGYYELQSYLPIAERTFNTNYDVILIKSKNIENQIFNDKYEKTLGYIVLNRSDVNSFVVKSFKTKEHFPLINSIFSSFNIFLTDINHTPLQLAPGIPSFVKLHLQKMERETKVLKLTSEISSTHPDNTNNKFSITLPEKLQIRGREWRIALSSICFKPQFATFNKEVYFRAFYSVQMKENEEPVDYYRTVTFPPGNYAPEDIVKYINTQFFPARTSDEWTISQAKLLKMIYENEKIKIKIGKYKYKWTNSLKIEISKDLLYFFGSDINELLLDNKEIKVFEKLHSEDIEFYNKVRKEGVAPPYILVYANFLQPSIVGSSYTKVLKILSVSNNSEYKKFEFEHLEFFKIESSVLETLSFEIRTHNGDLMRLAHDDKIVMSLILQK